MEENDLATDIINDELIEENFKRMPRKFTLHVTIGVLLLLMTFAFCQWVRFKLSVVKNSETQLDIMMKRQILESPAFKNSLHHYENNICVQYASEEEYMAIIRLKE